MRDEYPIMLKESLKRVPDIMSDKYNDMMAKLYECSEITDRIKSSGSDEDKSLLCTETDKLTFICRDYDKTVADLGDMFMKGHAKEIAMLGCYFSDTWYDIFS